MTKILVVQTTDEQKANLSKLADYLETLPEDYKEFDMYYFYFDKDAAVPNQTEEAYVEGGLSVACGTVACAVGHGPAAGIPFDEDAWYTSTYTGELVTDWGRYSRKFVNGGYSVEFDWMFSNAWKDVDNHHWGAAARIRFFLEHGGVPYDFDSYTIDCHPDPDKTLLALYAPYRKK